MGKVGSLVGHPNEPVMIMNRLAQYWILAETNTPIRSGSLDLFFTYSQKGRFWQSNFFWKERKCRNKVLFWALNIRNVVWNKVQLPLGHETKQTWKELKPLKWCRYPSLPWYISTVRMGKCKWWESMIVPSRWTHSIRGHRLHFHLQNKKETKIECLLKWMLNLWELLAQKQNPLSGLMLEIKFVPHRFTRPFFLAL